MSALDESGGRGVDHGDGGEEEPGRVVAVRATQLQPGERPEREPDRARAPERAAKTAVNPANASGASERVKDAASGSMPEAAR